MAAPAPPSVPGATPATDDGFPPPDLGPLFAAEDAPMRGGLVVRVALVLVAVALVVRAVRRRGGR